MRKLILFIILINFICSSYKTPQKFSLTIYEAYECNYCKFAEQQIKTIIQEYHLQPRLKLEIVHCQASPNLCRDTQKKPLIIIQNDKKEKLGQIGGMHSKLYFRDWILGLVKKNPIEIEKIKPEGQKYERIIVKNVEQVQQFFKFQTQSQKAIKNQKLNIIKQVQNAMNKFQEPTSPTNQQIDPNLQEQDGKSINFRSQVIGLIVITIFLSVFLIYLRMKKRRNWGYKKVGISFNDEE